MYVTRKVWYPDILKRLDSTSHPVHEIAVDGGAILRVLKLSHSEARSAMSR